MSDKPEPANNSISPAVWASLATAILSVIGVLSVALINANAQRALEREQFESNLILKAISTGDRKKSYENLRFLVEAHLIRAQSDKVSHLLQDTAFHFHIPTDTIRAPAPAPPRIVDIRPTFSGTVVDEDTRRPLKGVSVLVRTKESQEEQVTGSDGKFTMHYPLKNYLLFFHRPGYYPYSVNNLGSGRYMRPIQVPLERNTGQTPWQRLKKSWHLD